MTPVQSRVTWPLNRSRTTPTPRADLGKRKAAINHWRDACVTIDPPGATGLIEVRAGVIIDVDKLDCATAETVAQLRRRLSKLGASR